jgi:protein arginine kinase activator
MSDKNKCDKCGRDATMHVTEILQGQKIEKHLCQQCAGEEGIALKSQLPLSQILEELVLQTAAGKELAELRCESCGISFAEFRQKGLLGCPADYTAFENVLVPLVERAHEGASQHVGKAPSNAGVEERRLNELLRLRAELKAAVSDEQYERAVRLRDRIKELEEA